MLRMIRDFVPHVPRRRRVHFVLLMILMLVGAAAEMATLGAVLPFVTLLAEPQRALEFTTVQSLFSLMGWTQPESLLLPMTLLFVTVILIAMAIRLVLAWANNRFVFGLGYDVGIALYDRLLHQNYEFHIGNRSSSVIAALTKVQLVVNRVLKPLMDGFISIILAATIISTLLIISPIIAITAAVTLGGAYWAISKIVQRSLFRNSKIIAVSQTERVQAIQEGIGGIRDVILDGSQEHFLRSFARVDQRLRRAQAANSLKSLTPRYVIEGVGMLLLIGLAWSLSGSPGGLIAHLPILAALTLGAQRLLPLLQQIYNAWSEFTGNQHLMQDVLSYLSLPRRIPSNAKGANEPTLPSSILTESIEKLTFSEELELRKVSFRYASETPWVLRDLNLTIPVGVKLGIVGQTGGGKSTLMDIILGLLQPTEGELLVDGVRLEPGNLQAWQRKIAHVPQSVYLADVTIAENIAFGVPKKLINMELVRRAAQQAQLAGFIENLSRQYDHPVGERGIQLSGGQRQRLGIARALYKQSRILVLDEATSALDETVEAALMECIDSLSSDLTIIMIAHRLTTLRNCTQLIRLDEGRILHIGNYNDVVNHRNQVNKQDDYDRTKLL